MGRELCVVREDGVDWISASTISGCGELVQWCHQRERGGKESENLPEPGVFANDIVEDTEAIPK